ncbi:hypothetical protein A9995_03340 [Erythrobacter sp. QSSC1-22B]|uniref:hypothetical protein n=1 Tax=Erythrobacter sp. QSSC1-22B TaxID=1860125 RepID=UPI00080489DD|nr:hypothetical protein [Erythrobacter sp. QSSC1-22B]OBX20735.1 hypothetical protein A9995_03340 [Erythrobacter sp. QSSC1-22B]
MDISITPYLAHYSAAKQALATNLGATEDLLHLHAGLIIFFAAALFLRHRMRSRVPIALVYVFAFGNEVIDFYSPAGGATLAGSVADILNTIVWPTLLFLLARRRGKAGKPDRTH